MSPESPPVTEETVVLETINMEEEQPPPMHVIAGSGPVEAETGDVMSQDTPPPIPPRYTKVVVSRGMKDFGLELSLSRVS